MLCGELILWNRIRDWKFVKQKFILEANCVNAIKSAFRDVTAGATGATIIAPKFSDALTLFQPRGADSAQHCKGCTQNFPVVTSLALHHMWEQQKAGGRCLFIGDLSCQRIRIPLLQYLVLFHKLSITYLKLQFCAIPNVHCSLHLQK